MMKNGVTLSWPLNFYLHSFKNTFFNLYSIEENTPTKHEIASLQVLAGPSLQSIACQFTSLLYKCIYTNR